MIEETGLDVVIGDLAKASIVAGLKAAKVLDASGERIVETGQRLAPTTGLPHYAKTITHEVRVSKTAIEVEAGPERGGQGSLGHILERGTSNSPPHAHMGPSLDMEAPRALRDLGDVVDPFS